MDNLVNYIKEKKKLIEYEINKWTLQKQMHTAKWIVF